MQNIKKIHLAQLGAGYWGPNIIRNFVEIDEVEKMTVCDINHQNLEKIRRRFPGIKLTRIPDEVLKDPDIDAVVIALPAELHYGYAKKALENGKHVLVEKPLAMKTDEAEELIQLAKNMKKTLMVDHTFLFNSAVHKAKEFIDSGELGDIYYILAQRLNLGRVRHDINAMWNLAPHDISIVLFWLNELPSRVSAKGLTFLQDDLEDVVFIDLMFPSGNAAHVHVSWLHPNKTRKITVVGSKKMLVYDDVSNEAKIVIFDKGIDRSKIIRDLPDIESYGQFQLMQRSGDIFIPKVHFQEPLHLCCQHFANCITNDEKCLTDGQSGLEVVDILEKAQICLHQQK